MLSMSSMIDGGRVLLDDVFGFIDSSAAIFPDTVDGHAS
jgi:hypothetical protein